MKRWVNGGQCHIDLFFKQSGTETSQELEETEADGHISEYNEPDTSDKSEADEPPERKKLRAKQWTSEFEPKWKKCFLSLQGAVNGDGNFWI